MKNKKVKVKKESKREREREKEQGNDPKLWVQVDEIFRNISRKLCQNKKIKSKNNLERIDRILHPLLPSRSPFKFALKQINNL